MKRQQRQVHLDGVRVFPAARADLDKRPLPVHISGMAGQQIRPLTGIRGYLALWVFTFHAATFIPKLPGLHNPVVASGYFGVDGFFFLSGLVLFHVHGQEMLELSLSRTKDFLLLRLARIYPLHLFIFALFLAYVLVLLALGRPPDPHAYSVRSAIENLTLTHAWLGDGRTWNIPSWTISAEWLAYLAFPLLAWAACRTRPSLLLTGAIAVMIGFEFAYGAQQTNSALRVLPEFILGMAMARVALPPVKLAQVISVAALIIAGIGILSGSKIIPVMALAALVFALRTEGTLVGRFLATRWSLWLGEISYSIYMCQMFVLKFAQLSLAGRVSPATALALDIGLTLALAAACYRFVEVPSRRWIRQLHAVRGGLRQQPITAGSNRHAAE